MTKEEFDGIEWLHGNMVKLSNGKEYPVLKRKKRFLILYSLEYKQFFIADCHIVECRTAEYDKQVMEQLKIELMAKKGKNAQKTKAQEDACEKKMKEQPTSSAQKPKTMEYTQKPKNLNDQCTQNLNDQHNSSAQKPKNLKDLITENFKDQRTSDTQKPKALDENHQNPNGVCAETQSDAPVKKKRQRICVRKTISEKVNI